MRYLLDAGALIAIEKRGTVVRALLTGADRAGVALRCTTPVVAQVWRGGSRQANLARVLVGVGLIGLDSAHCRRVGELLGRSGTSDVVDAHLVLAAEHGDAILTSDPAEIQYLVDVRGIRALIVRV